MGLVTGPHTHTPPHPQQVGSGPRPHTPSALASPKGGTQTQARQEGNGTASSPPKHAKQGTGPGQDTRRGTDRVEQAYQRPASEPRELRAPQLPGEGGGARTSRERAPTHTRRTRGEYQKGNRTEPAERRDRLEWRTSERG